MTSISRLPAALACAASLALAGTTVRGAEPAAAGCCADPAQFHYDTLPGTGSVDVVIDAHDPSFEFQSGRSFFRAFRLPDATRGYTLEVQSFLEPATDQQASAAASSTNQAGFYDCPTRHGAFRN